MADRRKPIARVYDQIVEIAIRLLVGISCILAGCAAAIAFHKNVPGLAGSLISGIGAIGTSAVLRHLAYRLYPKLKRSDLRRVQRVPNPATLMAFGVFVMLLAAFISNVWLGVGLLSMMASGGLIAAAIAFVHRDKTLVGRDLNSLPCASDEGKTRVCR